MFTTFSEGNNNEGTGYVKKTQHKQHISNIIRQTQLDVLSSRQQLHRLFSSIMSFNTTECFAATSFQIRISRDLRTRKILQPQTGQPDPHRVYICILEVTTIEWLLYFHLQVNGCHYTNSLLLKGSRVRSRLPSLTWKQTIDLSSTTKCTTNSTRLSICQTGREVNELKITKAW